MSVQVPSPEASRRMSGQFDDDILESNGESGEGANTSEEKYHFYPYGRGSFDWTLEGHETIRKKSMDEIEGIVGSTGRKSSTVTASSTPTAGQILQGTNPSAKKAGTIGSKYSTAHNTYFLDEDLDMGPDMDNLGNVPGSGIHQSTDKDESGYHYYDPLSGIKNPTPTSETTTTWQWGKVDNIQKHNTDRPRTLSGSLKSQGYDNIPVAAVKFEDSGDFDRNMFKSEEAPKEWMAAADDGDTFAFMGKDVKAGAK